MTNKHIGPQTVALASPPSVVAFSNIGGKLESKGPLAASMPAFFRARRSTRSCMTDSPFSQVSAPKKES